MLKKWIFVSKIKRLCKYQSFEALLVNIFHKNELILQYREMFSSNGL